MKYVRKVGPETIIAKCPRCEKTHETVMFWSGNGTPRSYCVYCRKRVVGMGDTAVHRVMISDLKEV